MRRSQAPSAQRQQQRQQQQQSAAHQQQAAKRHKGDSDAFGTSSAAGSARASWNGASGSDCGGGGGMGGLSAASVSSVASAAPSLMPKGMTQYKVRLREGWEGP